MARGKINGNRGLNNGNDNLCSGIAGTSPAEADSSPPTHFPDASARMQPRLIGGLPAYLVRRSASSDCHRGDLEGPSN